MRKGRMGHGRMTSTTERTNQTMKRLKDLVEALLNVKILNARIGCICSPVSKKHVSVRPLKPDLRGDTDWSLTQKPNCGSIPSGSFRSAAVPLAGYEFYRSSRRESSPTQRATAAGPLHAVHCNRPFSPKKGPGRRQTHSFQDDATGCTDIQIAVLFRL